MEEVKALSIPLEVHIPEGKNYGFFSQHKNYWKEWEAHYLSFYSFFQAKIWPIWRFTSSLLVEISDEVLEHLQPSSSISEQTNSFGDGIEVIVDYISKKRSYLSKAADFFFPRYWSLIISKLIIKLVLLIRVWNLLKSRLMLWLS